MLKSHDLLVSQLLISHFIGIDRLLADKIVFETNDPLSAKTKDLNEEDIENLWQNFSRTFQEIKERDLKFQIITDEQGKP